VNQNDGAALGLTGKDGDVIRARQYKVVSRSPELDASDFIDLEHVGEVASVDTAIINMLVSGEFILIIFMPIW
jgi:acetylglutamate kinase